MPDKLSTTNIKKEMDTYTEVVIDHETFEMDTLDSTILQDVIRKKELEIISEVLKSRLPNCILDFGCGAGWLSRFIHDQGYKVIGIDITHSTLASCKKRNPEIEFIVCDAHNLPFKDDVFDLIIAIAILHHLHISALSEIHRVGNDSILVMEPNKLNFISHIGRVLFPMHTHTEGEEPFIPSHLQLMLEQAGFHVNDISYQFSIAFPFSRFVKILKIKPSQMIVRILSIIEDISEKFPILRRLNSIITMGGTKK